MENLCIEYEHNVDDYYNPTDIMDFYKYKGNKDTNSFLREVSDMKNVIVSDFYKILNYKIKDLKDSEELCFEIETLLDTYLNDVDFNIDGGFNFIVLNDEYLCFNNIENHILENLWENLEEEVCVSEVIVLVKRNFKEFYFIRKTRTFENSEEVTEAKRFVVLNDRVLSEKVDIPFNISYKNFSSDRFVNKISKVKKMVIVN